MQLTDTQLVILSQAAQRDDRAVVLPEKLKGGAAKKVIGPLLEQDLISECPAARDMPIWRKTDDGHRIALVITATGLSAIGISDEIAPEATVAPQAQQPKTKQETVLDLLRRAKGASIAELVTATGWQAHSVRGFLSGTVSKKLQMPLVSEKGEDGIRRYHIAAVAKSEA
jgi:hypothetical protein